MILCSPVDILLAIIGEIGIPFLSLDDRHIGTFSSILIPAIACNQEKTFASDISVGRMKGNHSIFDVVGVWILINLRDRDETGQFKPENI